MSVMSPLNRCNLCAAGTSRGDGSETARVRSNVRAFRNESFAVWRCGHCRSIHASEEIDLAPYYAQYPFHRQRLDWALRVVYRNVLRRLKRAGFTPSDSLLDYGCGSGLLIRFLHEKGFIRAVGYDAYSEGFSDRSALDDRYDFVYAQDVIEHVPDPRALMGEFADYVRPGGHIVIGTPNAEAIEFSRTDYFIHTLHQPYHTHILSKTALMDAARALGWTLRRYYPTQYTNTRIPCLNLRFGMHYGKCFDDTIDLAFDGLRFSPWLLSPRSLWLALFGSFVCPETDVMAVFRAPREPT